MKCPKCQSEMRVTTTYKCGRFGRTQRLQCSNERCGCVGTATVLLVNVNPGYGNGAASLAKKLAASTTIVEGL